MSLQRVLSPSSKQRLETTGNGHPKGVATVMSLLQRDPILDPYGWSECKKQCKEPDPVLFCTWFCTIWEDPLAENLVEPRRLELLTPCMPSAGSTFEPAGSNQR